MHAMAPSPIDLLTSAKGEGAPYTLICFSHLRWDFVFQRPQHLMTRFAKDVPVIYWEEIQHADTVEPWLEVKSGGDNITVATPWLPFELTTAEKRDILEGMLLKLLADRKGPYVRWYYTPRMLPWSDNVPAVAVVYDCMDELANFKNAPADLLPLEARLLARADVVFTGGRSLYEAKKDRHANTHCFPSSVDVAHFAHARVAGTDPADQIALSRPRLGFYGVIDERVDLGLVEQLATSRPDWSIVMLGPTAKIDENALPQRPNLHWLGSKTYNELPTYLRGWDVALMPFALNEATKFISPTKTPEYLAGGLPVVSTAIRDVVRDYGDLAAVHIADDVAGFIAGCEQALAQRQNDAAWRAEVDTVLERTSWDNTQRSMAQLIAQATRKAAPVYPVVAPGSELSNASSRYDVLVVGAGFAGAVMAERLAADGGKRVLVVDRRPHIAGNAYDKYDDAGVLMHEYGPHIFHTNSREIFDYLSRFTEWRPYEHRVLAQVDDKLVPMPINRTTLNILYGLDLKTDEEAEAYLESRAEPVDEIVTSADVVLSKVGRDLYEKFFQCYTRKQWGMDPSELDKSVTARVPTRTNTDDRYFTDTLQAMPLDGYTKMFERILDHPNIDVMLGVDYRDIRDAYPHDHLVFTGPIDEYFNHCYGRLPYRSLRFEHKSLDQEQYQSVGTVNYPAESYPYTRISEYKHITGQECPRTTITYEYPSAVGDPYYPIPRPENAALFKRYEALALAEKNVTFVGRLATYRYYNMDQVVGQALSIYRRVFAEKAEPVEKRELAAA